MLLISTVLYVYCVVYLVALPLLPFMAIGLPVAFLAAVVVGRSRPLVVFFRRFGKPLHQFLLLGNAIPDVAMFSRIVWLDDDPSNEWPPNKVRHPTPPAAFALLAMIIHILWALRSISELPLPWVGAAGVYIAVGSWILLEVLVGHRAMVAFVFFGGTLFFLTTETGATTASALQVNVYRLAQSPILVLMILLITSLRFRVRTINSDRRLQALRREARVRLCLFPRFILSSPALASYISCEELFWRPAVTELLRAGRLAVMDVSDLSQDSENLRWELAEARKEAGGILLVAEKRSLETSEDTIRQTLIEEGFFGDVPIVAYTQDGAKDASLIAAAHGLVRRRTR